MDASASDPLLDVLPPAVRQLAARGQIRRFRKGSVIVHEGSSGDAIYFVLQGRVMAYSSDGDGREVHFAIDGAGDSFGELALDGGLRSASVKALEPVVCALVACEMVWQHVDRDPAFARHLIKRLVARSRNGLEQVRAMALLGVYGRLRGLLEGLARPAAGDDTPCPIVEKMTHQAIANRIGASREMVTRLVNDLERGGYLRVERSRITLLKPLPERW